MQKNLREKLEELSSLGSENELRMPHIELCSNREVTVEGCVGIIEYTCDFVRLNCRNVTLKLCGDELCLGKLSGGCISVSGKIVSIEFV